MKGGAGPGTGTLFPCLQDRRITANA